MDENAWVKNVDPGIFVKKFNAQFDMENAWIREMAEPDRVPEELKALGDKKRALVQFLNGDFSALDKYEYVSLASHFPDPRLWKGSSVTYTDGSTLNRPSFTYADMAKKAKDFLIAVSAILPKVSLCPQCDNLFRKKDGRQRYCSKECQRKTSQPNDKTPERRAYLRVYMKFLREHEVKGKTRAEAVTEIKKEEPYAGLIRQWKIPVEKWTKTKGERHGA
ncbi:MAG: hypothetical protein ACYCRD_06575 [Leptospirillum sp.]